MQIEKSNKLGFCYGVKRAMEILDKEIKKHGSIEMLGEIVHNKQVLRQLAGRGVSIAGTVDEIKGNIIVLGTHGVTPETEKQIKNKHIEIVDTTCPFVRRAQIAARRLAGAGFFVIVYGDADHAEVKGILGWAGDKGIAADGRKKISLPASLRRIGILSQTTQIPSLFKNFTKNIFDNIYAQDVEIRVIDTICHDIRQRQTAALELAEKVDLMLVVGGYNSANTAHLAELCSTKIETHKIEAATEIKRVWLKGKKIIGITSGASTGDETIAEIVNSLNEA